MENKILQGYLNAFTTDFGIDNKIQESILFEHFSNYCILSKIHPEAFYNDSFKIEDLNIGGGNDTGIDGVAVVVNDHIVWSIEEIDALTNDLQKLEARFIFIQSKTSPKFDSSEIGTFIFGVKDFFKEKASLKTNEDLENLRKLKEYIYSKSILMDERPKCELYYITTGSWQEETNVKGRADSDLADLTQKGIFSTVEFIPVDANKLENIYKEVKNKVTKEINFEKHTPLPKIEGVKEAFIGILPLVEFFKLIEDTDGKIQKTLFYDNVRDFQGLNPVNKEIQETLKSKDKQLQFPILNNGVTLVAKSLNKVGTYFKVKDFQIVNGCQTSHILYNNKSGIDSSNTFVPIKIISTDNQDVINDIIKATNRQTEVKLEAFEALKDFHKKLQTFYDTFPKESKIYYERRPREYDTVFPPIPRVQIITLAAQINSVISMFLNEPHSTHRYYGELLKAYSDKIFKDNHQAYMYFVSSLALHKVDRLIKTKKINFKYRKFKYHLTACYRIIICGYIHPSFSSKDMNKYCEKLYNSLIDNEEMKNTFNIACQCIDKAILAYEKQYDKKSHSDYARLRNFTLEVIKQAKKKDSVYHAK
jgi:hypothetical protein